MTSHKNLNRPLVLGIGIFLAAASSTALPHPVPCELAKVTASDAAEHDGFGASVAVSGKVAVLGAPGDYVLTQGYYSETDDLDTIVQKEFGPGAEVADWTDVKATFLDDIEAFCDAVGLLGHRDNAMCYRNGDAWWSGNRHYFVERHEHTVPVGWLVHDHIDNHFLDLGSWYDLNMRILVRLPVTTQSGNAAIVGWGSQVVGVDLSADFVAVAAGDDHSLGLKTDGSIVAWGENWAGQCDVPAPNSDFVAVAGGLSHSLGLKADGSIVAWGYNSSGQCDVPAPNTDFVGVAAGWYHSLGLKADGSIVKWGNNDVPTPNTDFVAVAGGWGHSLGLKDNGSIVAWGNNYDGQCDVPEPNTEFIAVAAGGTYYDKSHSLGLKADGSIVAWGSNAHGQCNVPAPNEDFVALAAGGEYSLGLKADGSIVAWGANHRGQCNVAAPNTDFVGVAAGGEHSLGLKNDGSIVAWGSNYNGQCNVQAPNTDFVAVAAGWLHSLGLKADGSIEAWGHNTWGVCNVPAPNEDFMAVSAGWYHNLGLKVDGPIVAWGHDTCGECNVPAPNTDFTAVAVGYGHSLGLKIGGRIVAWGNNEHGQCDVPAPNTDFVAIAAGYDHSLGLKIDGSIVVWGNNEYGQCDVPAPNTDFVAVAAGYDHSLGLKIDDSIVAWGNNEHGQCDVPAPNTDFNVVAGGGAHSLGLKTDGSIVAWGDNKYGQCDVPAPNRDFVALAGGSRHSLGIKAYPRGDLDHDGDVDIDDFAIFAGCMGGPDNPYPAGCDDADLDSDDDVDLHDFSGLQTAFGHVHVSYRLYGLDFSPYMDGQDPNLGVQISEEQIRARMQIIAPYTHRIRTFGCGDGLGVSGMVAHELGLQAAIGAWLGSEVTPAGQQANQEQIANLIVEAQAGHVDVAIVGSEVLLRGDLTESQLISYIEQVQQSIPPHIPVTTADTYAELIAHPAIMTAVDVVFANYYPYWEGVDVSQAMACVHARHAEVVAAAGGKEVFVSEAGWPSCGNTVGNAVPSPENASFYFLNFVSWARAEGVDYFYFEAFDELWKAQYEGPQGACWGIWEEDGVMKPGMQAVFDGETIDDNWTMPGGPGDLDIEFTYVPPYGSFDNLEGQIWHVVPADHRVAVYIYVGGWWNKPYWAHPLTTIHCDGTWICDITTGGQDQTATIIAAFLVPSSYDPPLLSGHSTLPQELYDNALDTIEIERSP